MRVRIFPLCGKILSEEASSVDWDALNLIHAENENLDVNIDVILMLHRMMEEAASPTEAGKFKTRDNLIMEYQPDGTRRIRFTPVKAKETESAIEQLILAYYDARQDADIPTIFLIPCFIVDFLCIHPFLDGNGRVSRLLTVLMLYISSNKKRYGMAKVIRKTQDLTYLSWSHARNSSGTAGTYLKSGSVVGGYKSYASL